MTDGWATLLPLWRPSSQSPHRCAWRPCRGPRWGPGLRFPDERGWRAGDWQHNWRHPRLRDRQKLQSTPALPGPVGHHTSSLTSQGCRQQYAKRVRGLGDPADTLTLWCPKADIEPWMFKQNWVVGKKKKRLWLDQLIRCQVLWDAAHLNVEERVEVGDDDVFVLHLAPHVLDGVDGRLVIGLRAAAEGQLLHPHNAHLKERVEHQPRQLDRFYLWHTMEQKSSSSGYHCHDQSWLWSNPHQLDSYFSVCVCVSLKDPGWFYPREAKCGLNFCDPARLKPCVKTHFVFKNPIPRSHWTHGAWWLETFREEVNNPEIFLRRQQIQWWVWGVGGKEVVFFPTKMLK